MVTPFAGSKQLLYAISLPSERAIPHPKNNNQKNKKRPQKQQRAWQTKLFPYCCRGHVGQLLFGVDFQEVVVIALTYDVSILKNYASIISYMVGSVNPYSYTIALRNIPARWRRSSASDRECVMNYQVLFLMFFNNVKILRKRGTK